MIKGDKVRYTYCSPTVPKSVRTPAYHSRSSQEAIKVAIGKRPIGVIVSTSKEMAYVQWPGERIVRVGIHNLEYVIEL